MSTGGPLRHRAADGTEKVDFGPMAEVLKAGPGPPTGRAERRLAAIVRFIPVVVFSLDAEGLITSVSEAGVDMIDTSAVEVVGRSVFDFFQAPRIRRQIQRALAGHQVRGVHPGRPDHYFHTCLDPVFDRAGNLREVLGVSLDVTERWHEKQALRRMRQENRQRVEHGRLLDRVMTARADDVSRAAVDLSDPIEDLLVSAATASRGRRPG
jgi:PAS domain S-box-containing protein